MPFSDIRQSVSPGSYWGRTCRPLQNEVTIRPASDPGHLDLEVGDAVAIGIACQEAPGQAKLASGAGESRPTDEVKGLIAARRRIGVDSLEIDLVVLGMAEALDQIVVSADPAFYRLVEVESVPAGATDLHVAAETAD